MVRSVRAAQENIAEAFAGRGLKAGFVETRDPGREGFSIPRILGRRGLLS